MNSIAKLIILCSVVFGVYTLVLFTVGVWQAVAVITVGMIVEAGYAVHLDRSDTYDPGDRE